MKAGWEVKTLGEVYQISVRPELVEGHNHALSVHPSTSSGRTDEGELL